MDTKLKKWKVIVSFIAFFLSVSLLLGGVMNVASLLARGDGGWRNAFEKDYQNTSRFRGQMESYLEDFLSMATGGPIYNSYGYYGLKSSYTDSYIEDYLGSPTIRPNNGTIIQQTEPLTEWESEVWEKGEAIAEENWGYGSSWVPSPEEEKKLAEEYVKQAKALHEAIKEDKNILYTIAYEGKTLFTNADGGALDGVAQVMPEGYNFLMHFDGKSVSMVKDGRAVDVYGDGNYREDSDWYLPGYRNFTVDEKTAKATVSIAAVKTPAIYVKGNYSNRYSNQNQSQLYWLAQEMERTRSSYLAAIVLLAAGIVFFLLYLLLRKSKKAADQAIARGTGHVWFEVKLLIFLFALGVIVIAPFLLNHDLWYMLRDGSFWVYGGFFSGEIVSSVFYRLGEVAGLILPGFWVGYLFVNDLRYNKKSWQRSLCSRLSAVFRTADLKRPLQKRMMNQLLLPVMIGIVAAILLAVTFTYVSINIDFFSIETFLLIFAMLIVISFVAVLMSYIRRIRHLLQDTGALVDQIEAVRNGDLTRPLVMPTDADLCAAAHNLNDIQRGMNMAMEEQIKSERLKVELIANVSHDVKTPLTSIVSYVELLKQEEELPAHVKDYVRILDSKAGRLKTMIQDVFEVSKAASGQLPVHQESLDLAKLIRQTLADMAESIASSSLTIKEELPQEPVMVFADGQRLYRVFQNLLQNALQYSLDGSRVYVTLNAEGGVARACVKNTSRVEIPGNVDFTERFTRGDQSRTDGGSGLGLSIASSFTEACGGRFHVEHIADLFVATVQFPRILS